MTATPSHHKLNSILDDLLKLPTETDWVEFKDSYYKPDDIGEYLSALANSACIQNRENGYLIFGVENESHKVVGTSFRFSTKKKGNQPLEFWLNQLLQPKVGFEVEEFEYQERPIVLISIPAASGEPVRFNGDAYIRIGTCKTKLKNYPELERQIWMKASPDWSAQTIRNESLDRLDPEALRKARAEYEVKHRTATFYEEIDEWDDLTFLNKTRLTIDGVLTNAAIILLGKPESVHLIQPPVARLTWILRGEDDNEIDYAHFDPPFLLNVDRLFTKVRNLNIRELPDGTLFPVEISQYDPWVMREALHNCIAHQDYRLCSRISLIERPDSLLFVNAGTFIPGSVEAVLTQDAPQQYYPNRFLTEAMVNLNMIDTIGSGIKRMFTTQKSRYMPMPDFDFSTHNEVRVALPGRVLDENYTKLLIKRTDLPLDQVVLLDRVQKRGRVSKDDAKLLRRNGLVEGRYPNLYIAAHIASTTGDQAQYIKNRAFDDNFYKQMVADYLRKYGYASRNDIDNLLTDKLSDVLNSKQKLNKIRNLLHTMSRERIIINEGSRRYPKWRLILEKKR